MAALFLLPKATGYGCQNKVRHPAWGERREPKLSVSVARFVCHSPQARQLRYRSGKWIRLRTKFGAGAVFF